MAAEHDAEPGPGEDRDEALEAAIGRLLDGERLRAAEARVLAAAPALQRVLAEALADGGWFGESQRAELTRLSAIEEATERERGLATLLAEEARIAMLVGVATGWALAEELEAGSDEG